MKTSYIVVGIVLVVVIIGGIIILKSNNAPQVPSAKEEGMGAPLAEQPQSSPTVIYSDGGYAPGELKIKKGETVTFKNESSQPMWTASAIHPSHQVYPGSGIQKCGTPEQSRIFDACQGVAPGGTWVFQFNEAGSWGYHNHLRPSHWGKVIVE